MPDSPTSLDFAEPPSPEALLPSYGLLPWWVAAEVAVIAIIVLMLMKRRKMVALDPSAARRAALQDALTALKETRADNAREAAVQASLILRRYLATAAGDPALFETHEEFISRHDALQALTPDARNATGTTFSKLATLKYAPELPQSDPSTVLSESTILLETIHGGFTA
jgi:hypothetical protein